MLRYKLHPLVYIANYGPSFMVGRSDFPFNRMTVGAGALSLLLSFKEPRNDKEVLSDFTAFTNTNATKTLAATLAIFRDQKLIVPAGRKEDPFDPASIKYSGFEVSRCMGAYPDIEHGTPEFLKLYQKCKPYSITSVPMMYSMYLATQNISKNKINGAIVECGVWRGGNIMLSASLLVSQKDTDRPLFLYDTFECEWESPTKKDGLIYSDTPMAARSKKNAAYRFGTSFRQVAKVLASTGYPKKRTVLVKGFVQDTIPKTIPETIALLRLDTDFFESTYHELSHLYPRLAVGGILLIDDYGKYKGATEAVDKYFRENKIKMLLNRIELQGRMGVKIES